MTRRTDTLKLNAMLNGGGSHVVGWRHPLAQPNGNRDFGICLQCNPFRLIQPHRHRRRIRLRDALQERGDRVKSVVRTMGLSPTAAHI